MTTTTEPAPTRRRARLRIAVLAGLVGIAGVVGLLAVSDDDTGAASAPVPDGSSRPQASVEAEIDPKLISVEVEVACVNPGQRQTIHVEGNPGTRLIYQAVYSDGATGLRPDYYGGNERGQIGQDGTFTDSWVVGTEAPPGPVRFDVHDVYRFEDPDTQIHTQFSVADADGRCG